MKPEINNDLNEHPSVKAFENNYASGFELWQLLLLHARLTSYHESAKARGLGGYSWLSERIQKKTQRSCSRKTVTDFLKQTYFDEKDSNILKPTQAIAIAAFLTSPDIGYLKSEELTSIDKRSFAPEEFAKYVQVNYSLNDIAQIDEKLTYVMEYPNKDSVFNILCIGKRKGAFSFDLDLFVEDKKNKVTLEKLSGVGVLVPSMHIHMYLHGERKSGIEKIETYSKCHTSANPFFQKKTEYTCSSNLYLLNYGIEEGDDFTVDEDGNFSGRKETHIYQLGNLNDILTPQTDNTEVQNEEESLPIFARRKRKNKSRLAGAQSIEQHDSTLDDLMKGIMDMSEDENNKKGLGFHEELVKHSILHCYFTSAVKAGDIEGAVEAIHDGAPLNEPRLDTGMTGIHLAASKGDRDMVISILKTGKCDILQRNRNGELAADMAYRYGNDMALGRLLMYLQCKEIDKRGLSRDYLNPHYDEQFTPS